MTRLNWMTRMTSGVALAVALAATPALAVDKAQASEKAGESPSATAQASSPDQAAALAELLRDYRTYQASFIQIVVDDSGKQIQDTRGILKAKRPGLFYWETKAPLAQVIVSDGKQVQVYDPDLEQVTVQALGNRIQSTPALLFSGQVEDLETTYRVKEGPAGDNTRQFTLEPRSPDSLFTSLRLTFNNGRLKEMRMRDSLSQFSILSFDHIKLNEPVPDSAFTLDYPDGVDVIREGQ